MISVTLKMMSGDLIEISKTPVNGESEYELVQRFELDIYRMQPSIPIGCLQLLRPIFVDEEEDFEDVTHVQDGDLLYAMVDTTLVCTSVEPLFNGAAALVSKHGTIPLNCFCVDFLRRYFEHDEDARPVWTVRVCFAFTKGFALFDRLLRANQQRYHETPSVQWFPTVQECLLSVDAPRFPTDQQTLDNVARELNTFPLD